MSLHCLVYVSVATREMSDSDLQDILEKSRAKNEKSSVTGMLLYRDGFFAQALEGELDVIEKLFATISKDERHRIVFLMYTKPIQNRSFADWSMGFNKSHDDHLKEVVDGKTNLLEQLPPDFFLMLAGELDSILNQFRH